MNHKELEDNLFQLGFIIVGVPENSAGKLVYALHDDNRMELIRVSYDSRSNSVEATSGNRSFSSTLESDLIVQNIEEMMLEIEKQLPSNDDDLKVARLIREVKTLRLRPQDRLAVVIKDAESVNRKSLDQLREAMLRWLGEKNSNRIMIMVGDIELTKVDPDAYEGD